MSRLLRWFTYFILFLVALLALAYGAAQFMKPKILETVTDELKRNVNGDVLVGGLDFTIFEQFPVLSITLSDVHLRGPGYKRYHREFFSAGKIYIHAKPLHVWRGEINLKSITIRDANISIFRTLRGYTNLDVFKKRDTTGIKGAGGEMSLDVAEILLENSHFTYFDSAKRKSYGAMFVRSKALVRQSDTSRLLSLKGPMVFDGLMFNEANGRYLKSKEADAALNFEFIPKHHRLLISASVLEFNESTVSVSGFFNFQEPGTFGLDIHSDALKYAEGLTIVTPALAEKLGKFTFDEAIALTIKIGGVITRDAKPKVDIAFNSKDNHGVTGKLDIRNLAFTGTFTNHLSGSRQFDDKNSRITADTFSGVFQGIPFNANFSLTNLEDPALAGVSRINTRLTELNKYVDPAKLRFSEGTLVSVIEYEGKLNEYLDTTASTHHGKLEGRIEVKNGSWEYLKSEKTFQKTDMNLRFTEKQLDIDKVVTTVNGNTMDLNGTVTGFVPFLYQPKEKGNVKLFLHSQRLDIATLIKKKTARKKTQDVKGNKGLSEFIDAMYAKTDFEVDFQVDELISGPFRANAVVGKIRMADNRLFADPLSMKLAGGTVNIRARMSDLHKSENPVALYTRIRDADIKKMFRAFRNFSQKSITAENLSGKISAVVNLTGRVDDNFSLKSPTVRGVVDLRIKNGRIQDFPPLQNLSNFLFKKRDFTDVQFAEIRSHFRLQGRALNIQRMEVESTVLTLFLEGRYSPSGDTDLSIQVPLSNLKKRDKDYKPENVGVDAKVGPSVFLRARQKDGSIVIAYDPLKKFRKR